MLMDDGSGDDDDLFSRAKRIAEAKAAKEAGMQQSEDNADKDWADLMFDLVEQVCRAHHYFTADDVFDLYDKLDNPPQTHDRRAFGPVMSRAARAGYCRKLNTTEPSRRKSLHASPRAIWESLIHE